MFELKTALYMPNDPTILFAKENPEQKWLLWKYHPIFKSAKSAVKVKKAFQNDFEMKVYVSTAKKVLYKNGLGSSKKIEKPKLSVKNIKARLAFTKAHWH